MSETKPTHLVAELATLPPETVVYEKAMCELLDRSSYTLKRAVARGELPAPFRLLGRRAWTAGAVVRHLQHRQDEAVRRHTDLERRVAALQP